MDKQVGGLSCLAAGILGSLTVIPAKAASTFANVTSNRKFCIYYGDFSNPATLTGL